MKNDPIDLKSPSYTPAKLLHTTAAMLHCKNDSRLALALEVDKALITRVRRRQQVISPGLMVRIMDRTGWHIQEVRRLAGIPFDGVARLVVMAQRIGFRHPHMWTQKVDDREAA
jgi:hypothetical protein